MEFKDLTSLPGNDQIFEYDARLTRIRKFVEEKYSEKISLERAARVAAMEKTYFSSFFSEKVGITFSEWLRMVRIQKAIEMLKKENFTIVQVSNSVGFGDVRTFERAFRKYTDKTPYQFKKVVRPG